MKKYFILIVSLLSTVWYYSCKDNTDANLPDSQVYIVNADPTKNVFTLYTTGQTDTCFVSVYRSGKYGKEVNATVRTMTESELSTYNTQNGTSYTLLPSNCYQVLESTVSFTKSDDDVIRLIPVIYNPELVLGFQNASPDVTYVVPFIIENSNVTISPTRNVAFIKTQVGLPLIYLGMTGSTTFTYDVSDAVPSLSQTIPVNVDFSNLWDINCTISSNNQAYVDSYNTSNNTTFSLLPSTAYTIDNSVLLAAGKKTANINLAVDGSKVPYGKFILPIQLTASSKFSVSSTANTYYYSFSRTAPVLARTGWKIAYCSTWEPTATAMPDLGTGLPENILDGNATTCWFRRVSSGGTPENPSSPVAPFVIIVDMGQSYYLTEISLTQGQTSSGGVYSYLQGGEFLLTDDDIPSLIASGTLGTANWKQIGTFTTISTKSPQAFSTFRNNKGRYLKINMSNLKSNYAFLAELTARGALQ